MSINKCLIKNKKLCLQRALLTFPFIFKVIRKYSLTNNTQLKRSTLRSKGEVKQNIRCKGEVLHAVKEKLYKLTLPVLFLLPQLTF